MNELSGAEALVLMLQRYGVRHIFGLCGDTSLPFYDALYRLNHGITHILTRDERHASYMADAYARVTGKPGVCEGPSGGGATYILPGVVEANESSIPILAITSDIGIAGRGRYVLTELDQEALFRPLTKWNTVIEQSQRLPAAVRHAFREMTTGTPGAVHLGLPIDVQRGPVDQEEVWADPAHTRYPALPAAPDPQAVNAFLDALSTAATPVIICGGGLVIADGMSELERFAELLGIPVATTISGQGSISEEHPLAIGVVGSNGGTPETRALVEQADLVIFIGCRAGSVTTERWRYPAPGRTRILHIDSDPAVIGANYPTEAVICADARLALAALLKEAAYRRQGHGRDATPAVLAQRNRKAARFARLAGSDETPIRPERVIAALRDALPDDAVIVADPGTPCPYVSAWYEQRRRGRYFISNRAHGALGYALPAVVGAAIGRPGSRCVAVMGDGSFGMAAGELETIQRLDLPVILIVISNSVFGWIKAGQKASFGERYQSVDFNRTRHAAVAEAYGIKAWRVEQPEELAPTLKKALAASGPTLIDIVCQPLQEAAAPVSEWIA